MSIQIPQSILAALEEALQARLDVDEASNTQDQAAANLTMCQQDSDAATANLDAKVANLEARRQALEALENQYLKRGGSLPSTPTPAT